MLAHVGLSFYNHLRIYPPPGLNQWLPTVRLTNPTRIKDDNAETFTRLLLTDHP